MLDSLNRLQKTISEAISALYQIDIDPNEIVLSDTRKEYRGQYTWVTFPFAKVLKQSPVAIAENVGAHLKKAPDSDVANYNVVKGFLNLGLKDLFWHSALDEIDRNPHFGKQADKGQKVLVEFASPNTNKPIHLGHIRNILLGWATSRILDFCGYEVVRTQIVNDRGIAICKSMLAWKKYGNGECPAPDGMKGDHLVGKYYIRFEKELMAEYRHWQEEATAKELYGKRKNPEQNKESFFKQFKNTYFNEYSNLGKEAKELLIAWESRDQDTMALWRTMNQWVYDGFDETYKALEVKFDSIYYESDTYLLGKDIVSQGLASGHFYRAEDGSVWVDLEDAGLDKKILLRSDGTSVYMTQDLGTAQKRFHDYGTEKMIYVVADEQDYHFQVLFEILKKLGEPYAQGLFHLSYGMVDLPGGRMKSREGTVVDADELIGEVINAVRESAKERGALEDLNEREREEIYQVIGMAALKFFILRVNPQRRMTFNPEESVDIQGQTGPYIQNAYVRIRSVLRKQTEDTSGPEEKYEGTKPAEKDLIQAMLNFPMEIEKAALAYDPSGIANYAYDLAKKFHKFYHEVRILNAQQTGAEMFRLRLAENVARILKTSMYLLGIRMPERM